MSNEYKMHTEIGLDRTKREIIGCLNAWKGADFLSIGDYRDQANEREAVVVFDFNGQRIRVVYDRLCCHRCNMRAIFKTLDALRLMYKRQMGDILINTVAQMLALPGAQYIDPYEFMGVRPDADMDIVDAVYKSMAKKLHPDAPGGTKEKMQQLNEAYERIKSDRESAA